MAKYKLQEMSDVHHTGKRKVYPKMVVNRTLSRKEFIERMQGYHRGISASTTEAVLMDVDGVECSGAGFGVGAVDAVFNVINQIVKREPELETYAVNAVTGGTDAQGEVTVRLSDNGYSAVGRGAHPDVLVAGARAYVNALNRLAKKERDGESQHCQHCA